MAEPIAIPEAPKKVLFPLCFRGHEPFTAILNQLVKIVGALPSHQLKQFCAFMQTVLYPSMPKGSAPDVPSSLKKFKNHLQQYCGPLNIGPLKMLSKHLENDDLTRQLEECERTLSDQLQEATWDTPPVNVAPPPEYKIMLVKMKKLGNTTVREAVEVRDFLAEHLMFKGHHGILCLAGLANDSLVFYLSEGNIGPMLQRMQHKKDSVLAAGVDVVTFVNLVKLDVASGDITPGPNVPKRDPAEECPEFSVLLVGETGSGKSTLINNLLGEQVAPEGHTCYSETDKIMEYRGKAAGVPVTLYDTPGTDDMTAAADKNICKEIKRLVKSKKICLALFCFSMNEQRVKRSHISTMRAYNEVMVNWENAIVALTFADKIKGPHTERKSEGFDEAEFFRGKIAQWKATLKDTLVRKVGVPQSVAEKLIMRPTTDKRDLKLLDNEEWFVPLWLDILDLLAPAAYFRFLEIHQAKITFEREATVTINRDGGKKIHLTDTDMMTFKRIAEEKLRSINSRSTIGGVGGAVIALGGAGAVISFVLGAAGIPICGIGVAGILIGTIFIVGSIVVAVHVHGQSQSEENE